MQEYPIDQGKLKPHDVLGLLLLISL